MNIHATALTALAHLVHMAEEHVTSAKAARDPIVDPEGPNIYWLVAERFSVEHFGSAILTARIPHDFEEEDTLDGPPMKRCETVTYRGDPNGTVFVREDPQ